MKKLIFQILFSLILAFTLVFSVTAQNVDDPALGSLTGNTSDISGVTCGVAESPFANRCCKVSDVDNTTTRDLLPDFACLEIPNPFGSNPKACISDIINVPANVVVGLLGVDKVVQVGQTASSTMNPCTSGVPTTNSSATSCICKLKEASSRILCDEFLTSSASSKSEYGSCVACANNKGVWTGLGCIPTNQVGAFVRSAIFNLMLGIAGASALICILYAAFILQTSRGNPEKIKKAKEMLRACITGLLLVIFSVLILKVIGVDILRIPGLAYGHVTSTSPSQKPFPVINRLVPTS